MLPVQPYRPGGYPPGPRWAQFGDDQLAHSTSIAHEARGKLAAKRQEMVHFHIGKLQEDGYLPAFEPGMFQTNRDPAEQGVRGFDHFDIGRDDAWDDHLGNRYTTQQDGVDVEDYSNYNPDHNPFMPGRHADFPGLPASMGTSTRLDKQTQGRQRSEHQGEDEGATEENVEEGGEGSGRGRLRRAWGAVKTGFRHATPVGQVGGAVAGAGLVAMGYMGGGALGLGWGGAKGAATLVGNALSPYPRNVEDYSPAEPTYGGSSSSSGPAPPKATATPVKVDAVPPYLLDAEERAMAARQAPPFTKHLGNLQQRSLDRRKLDNQAKKDGTYWSLTDTRKP